MNRTLSERPGVPGSAENDRGPEPPGFLSAYPGYRSTVLLDRLRATEYSYLDAGGHVYLDYTGAGLSAQAQLTAHAERLRGGCFRNPHSENPASAASTELIERARLAVLAHFRAAPEECAVIFTPNATGACRLVGEAYPFGLRTRLVLTQDNHNSVNGIREFARSRGAITRYVPFCSPELRIDDKAMRQALAEPGPGRPGAAWRVARCGVAPWAGRGWRARRRRSLAPEGDMDADRPAAGLPGPATGRRRGLLAHPSQSNFSGVQHPMRWIRMAHEHGYDVLLDAAAYVPSSRLDLSVVKPDSGADHGRGGALQGSCAGRRVELLLPVGHGGGGCDGRCQAHAEIRGVLFDRVVEHRASGEKGVRWCWCQRLGARRRFQYGF